MVGVGETLMVVAAHYCSMRSQAMSTEIIQSISAIYVGVLALLVIIILDTPIRETSRTRTVILILLSFIWPVWLPLVLVISINRANRVSLL